ncbi:MAG: hypothetical protein EZS28_023222 [Streblomastix strix]|uniref:Uncharacterized protein n=1 Tax=Streblomastix strix TaxID=222440 RepID=A0A5J4VFP0_9EUKA|nr:MAG: hypothetical protein EZS28_023222 [Streblomastix strix]
MVKASIGCIGGLLCFGGFLRVTKSLAALARCLAYITCSTDCSSSQKSICDVYCPESPIKSARIDFIAFCSDFSGLAIVQSGFIGSISMFWRNASSNVNCCCAEACSGFCGIKLVKFGIQYEFMFGGRLLVNLVLRVILTFVVFKMAAPLQTLFGEWPEESLQIFDGITQQR